MKKLQPLKAEWYTMDYDNRERFMSYWHQINEALALKPKTVLEVGTGCGVVANYLRFKGVKVSTMDISPELRPDYLLNFKDLHTLGPNKFDVVICCQLLEHFPLDELEGLLSQLSNASREYVIISVPHYALDVSVGFNLHHRKKILKLKIPSPKKLMAGEHYWELGRVGDANFRFYQAINKFFTIEKDFILPENMYHRMLVLRKCHVLRKTERFNKLNILKKT